MKRILLFVIILLFASTSYAADYHAEQGGTSAIGDCTGADPGAGNRCSLATVNTNMSNGDVAYLYDDGGDFTTDPDPNASGTAASMVKYEGDENDTVVINACNGSTNHYGVDMDGGAIELKNLVFNGQDCTYHMIFLDNMEKVIFDNISIESGSIINKTMVAYNAFEVEDSEIVEVKNSTFDTDHSLGQSSDQGIGNILMLQRNTYMYIHDNIFRHSEHQPMVISNGEWIIVENNLFENKWRHGSAAYRTVTNVLWQNNIYEDVGISCDDCPWEDDDCVDAGRAPTVMYLNIEEGGIVRFNQVLTSGDRGITFGTFTGGGHSDKSHQKIYHNSFYNPQGYSSSSWSGSTAIAMAGTGATVSYCDFVNNIIYGDHTSGWDLRIYESGGTIGTGNRVINNIFDRSTGSVRLTYDGSTYTTVAALNSGVSNATGNIEANPQYNDAANSDISLSSSSSDAIDGGAWLATIDSVSSNTLTLTETGEAYYFWPGLSQFSYAGDTIYDDDGNSAVVQSRDTAANTITVDDATGFTAGDTITVVNYNGSAPDIGYAEYVSGIPTVAVGEWTMENVITDASGNGNDLGQQGTVQFVSGGDQLENAYSLDQTGTSNYPFATDFWGTAQQLTVLGTFQYDTVVAAGSNGWIVAQYDWGAGTRSYGVRLGEDENLELVIGYNSGASAQIIQETTPTTLTIDTQYWFMAQIDDRAGRAYVWLKNTSKTDIFTPLNVALTGSWAQPSANFTVGVALNSGTAAQGFEGYIDAIYLYEGLLPETDFENIIDNAVSASPEMTSNGMCSCTSPYAYISGGNESVTTVGEEVCAKAVFNEPAYLDGGVAEASQVVYPTETSGGGADGPNLTLDTSTYGTTTWVFKYTTTAQDRYSELRSATSGLADGTANIEDADGNDVDIATNWAAEGSGARYDVAIPGHFTLCDSGCDWSDVSLIESGDVVHINGSFSSNISPNSGGATGIKIIYSAAHSGNITMNDATSRVINSSTHCSGNRFGTANWDLLTRGICGDIICGKIRDDTPTFSYTFEDTGGIAYKDTGGIAFVDY